MRKPDGKTAGFLSLIPSPQHRAIKGVYRSSLFMWPSRLICHDPLKLKEEQTVNSPEIQHSCAKTFGAHRREDLA
jgi:hypothetical protein